MDIILAVAGAQVGIVGMLFNWLRIQGRDNKIRIDKMYSKAETKEMIDIKLKPIEVGIAHVQDELKEVKHMIGRLLDEKNKG